MTSFLVRPTGLTVCVRVCVRAAEFDALVRLGIPDPSSYIKKRYKSNKLLFLRAACVGQTLVDQVEASVEEAVSSATWTDIQVLARGPTPATASYVSEFSFLTV